MSAMEHDFYELLGVGRDADGATIKSAYRKLAMQYHPDRNGGCKENEDKFKAVSAAYECLKDPQNRVAEAIIGRALLRVLEAIVGGADRLELGLVFLAPGVTVRVMLHREPAVGGLDRRPIRVTAHAEQFVKVRFDRRHIGPAPNLTATGAACTGGGFGFH